MAAEKLRSAVQGEVFPAAYGRAPGRLTVSIGLACYPADGNAAEELEHAARQAPAAAQALYHNKVMAASPPVIEGDTTA